MKKLNTSIGFLIVALLLALLPNFVMAQTSIFTGRVIDAQKTPVMGVTIVVKGSTVGTVTNIDGQFEIKYSKSPATLIVNMLGYESQEITATNSIPVVVTLKESIESLDDVVVIGYSAVAKKDVTGAVSVVSGKELSKMPVTSANNILQGKVAGVTITSTSGTPGAPSVARIRGVGSVNFSSTPLYIVDGLPQKNIDYLNPNDIEAIAVHKDASVAAIYGSRGSNGIIIVTTKSGKNEGRMEVTYDGYVGFQSPWKRPHMLNAEEFIRYKNLAADNAGEARVPAFETQESIDEVLNFVNKNSGSKGTDWWNEIINSSAFMQSHNASLSAGTKNIGITSSLAYTGQDGIVKGSEYQRISWRNNFNANISKRITFAGHLAIISENSRYIDENNPYTGTIFSAMGGDPITPVFRNNLTDVPVSLGDIYYGYEYDNKYSQYAGFLFSNKRNPVAQIERMRNNYTKSISIKGGGNLGIKLLDVLTFNSHFGFDLVRANSFGFTPKYTLNSHDLSNESAMNQGFSNIDYYVWEQTLNYEQTFGKFKIGGLLGTSAELTKAQGVTAGIEGFVSNNLNFIIFNNGTKNPSVSGYPYSSSLVSLFGRVSLNYDGRYILTGSVRRDGSSRFAKGSRWGTFPSVSGAWRFSSEKFMKATESWLSDAKLRVSYGLIGNQEVGGGAYMSAYGSGIYDRFSFGDEFSSEIGGGRTFIGNPVLKWETSKQLDLGLDLNFFNGKIEFTADYFHKNVDNMLIMEPQPAALGFTNFPYANVGSMTNKGWEFSLGHHRREGDFQYSIVGNISSFKNEVTSLGNGDAIYGEAYLKNTITKTEVGRPVGYFYGYKTNGIFQNAAQVEGSAQRDDSTPGDVRYKDLDGDDFITSSDRTMIGNPWPDFVYGLTLNMSYKNFDFSIFFQGSQGNDIMNMTLYDYESGTGYLNAPRGYLDRAWSGEGSTDRYHKISANQGLNNLVSDYFVEDGSYLRIKNAQIGYTLPAKWTRRVSISSLRVYFSAQNLFTFTKYSGLDPEIGATSSLLNGIDQGFYPQARTMIVGLNIKF